MTSFTDKVIKDLDQNEKDAKRAKISRLAVLKETIEDIGGPFFMVFFVVFVFIFTTYNMVITYNQIPQLEEGISLVFKAQGVFVEVLDRNNPILSGMLESIEISFVELGEMAQRGDIVYYSRKPSPRFFIVDEYWNVGYHYTNERLDSACSRQGSNLFLSPVSGIGLLLVATLVYKQYKIKYKEMAGF